MDRAFILNPKIFIVSSLAFRKDSRDTIFVLAVDTSWVRYSIWTDSGVTARPLLFLAAGRGTLGRVPVTRRGAGGAEKVVVEGEKVMEGTDWNVVVEMVDKLGEEKAISDGE